MTDRKADRDAIKLVARLLDRQHKTLLEANADPDVARALASIIKYVHNLSDLQIDRLLNQRSANSARRHYDMNEMEKLSLAEVETIALNQDTSRTELESVAVGRFHVPRGSLRSLGNYEQLREKVLTMMRNERAHTTIADVVKDRD